MEKLATSAINHNLSEQSLGSKAKQSSYINGGTSTFLKVKIFF